MSCPMKKPVEIKLIKHSGTATDDWGNPIAKDDVWTIFAQKMSVTSAEFYRASNQGLKPSLVFEIYEEEFGDADLLIYEEAEYTIIRTYQRTLDRLELICEKKVKNGN